MTNESINLVTPSSGDSLKAIELYLSESKTLMEEINIAIQLRHADTAYEHLIVLTSSSKEIGATVFAQLCSQIGFCLKEYRWPETLLLLKQLNSWYNNLVSELQKILLKRS
jgi:hypothetical protein